MSPVQDYHQIQVDQKENYLFDRARGHLEISHYILNGTKLLLYVRDAAGGIFKVPPRPCCCEQGNVILVNTVYTEYIDQINNKQTVTRFKITPSRVGTGRMVYVRELGMYVSSDPEMLRKLPLMEVTPDVAKKALLSAELHRLRQCPIRIILHDPSEALRNVYGIIDNQIYRIPVVKDSRFGGDCIIQFASKYENEAESIYSFDIDELKAAFQSSSGCMKPEIGGYNFLIYPTLVDAEEYVTTVLRNTDKKLMLIGQQEREKLKQTYDSKIAGLEDDIRKKDALIKEQDQEIRGLRKLMDLTSEKEKRDLQYTTFEHQARIQALARDREQAKVEKSENDLKVSNAATGAAIAKTAAVTVPIVLSAVGLYLSKGTTTNVIPALGAVCAIGVFIINSFSWLSRHFLC
jgi:hypothetical protein